MIKLISGKYGPKLLGPGSVLNLSTEDEKRLVDRKVAVYINTDSNDEKIDENEQLEYKSIEELNKIRSKKDLIKYAEKVGLHDLDENDKKDSLVVAIANYLEENFEQE